MNKKAFLLALVFGLVLLVIFTHAQEEPEKKADATGNESEQESDADERRRSMKEAQSKKKKSRRYDDEDDYDEREKEAPEEEKTKKEAADESKRERKSKKKSRRDYDDDYIDEYEEARARRRKRSRRYDDYHSDLDEDMDRIGRRGRDRRPPHFDDYDSPSREHREPPKRDPEEERQREERFQQMRRRMEENSKKKGYGDIISNRGEQEKPIYDKFEKVLWGEEHPFFTHWINQVSNWAPDGKIVDNFIKMEARHVSLDVVKFSETNNIDLSKELIYTGHIEYREELQGYDIQLSKKVVPFIAARPRALKENASEKKSEL